MADTNNGALQTLIDVAEGERTLTVSEFEEIIADLETQTKYTIEDYNMFCTSEDIVVVCDTDTEEFVQIEIPMSEGADGDQEVIVTRDT
ncbi:hypothetical protein HTSR_0659 [Halodesulfurarchaeum formicicum]|uniref:Halobacterial output domain-containing protein n=1 Tax=Halodesulfurarchaeum formicicum TaxID=1873524 RepID=A0A1D8S3B1_9EURY|nr:hypothetical protein [Halodesulfurarchaeum formicicum]AOW79852.1 hypothetical protein HTSR_0659 [Halodesulfurarchaeum formicicum]APE95145.1 hypothetical protein HSR6_0685 [Halodesulfurarchaeum formicicum]